MEFKHYSVLLDETIENLSIKPDGVYMDGTLGGAGHAFHVCERLGAQGHFYGIDQDGDAIEAAAGRLSPFGDKVTIIRSNYRYARERLNELGVTHVDGIVLDLGVSSYQLDTIERGFSYKYDTRLDMRMDDRMEMTAKDIVNDYSEEELRRVIRNYGEDKFAAQIARNIVKRRANEEIKHDILRGRGRLFPALATIGVIDAIDSIETIETIEAIESYSIITHRCLNYSSHLPR